MVLFISAVMWSEVLTVIPAAEQQRFNEKQHVSFPLCLHVESWEMYSTLAWVPGLIITPLFSDIGNFGSQYTFLETRLSLSLLQPINSDGYCIDFD